MDFIASLNTVRIATLDRAEKCETVWAMRCHQNLANAISRVMSDIQNGIIKISSKEFWATLIIDKSYTSKNEGLYNLIEDLRDLGIRVIFATQKAELNNQSALDLAA